MKIPVTHEEYRTIYEVYDPMQDFSEFFNSEREARADFDRMKSDGNEVHLHSSQELYIDGEPTGDFSNDECLETFEGARAQRTLVV